MTTIHDVAAHAGVSISTVSRALNGKTSVDPVLSARVQAAAAELGYHPNWVARNLRRQCTAIWALIIADIENPFFTAIARGVEDVAEAAGHSIVLCNSDEDVGKEERYLRVAVAERVAGVVLSPTSPDADVSLLIEHRIPVVVIDRPVATAHIDTVLVNTRLAARQATAHLIEGGYHRIACITGPRRVYTAEDRLAGYCDALRAARRRVVTGLVRYADFKVGGGHSASESLLTATPRPDALFIANNLMAVGALETLKALGLQVGADVGVVTFDDAPWTRLVNPPISVVAQPAYQIGEVAGRLLADRVTGGTRAVSTITLDAQLIIRDSSTGQPLNPRG
ncbi:MAG: LacI family transcriptional regulator [Actinomycetota bacterium]|nr:LacI family transcriptional regulator [Actinomycetota bacterium]